MTLDEFTAAVRQECSRWLDGVPLTDVEVSACYQLGMTVGQASGVAADVMAGFSLEEAFTANS